jgi:DNA-binding NtrC family response regulator
MVVLAGGDTLTMDDVPAIMDTRLHDAERVSVPAGATLEELEREAVEQAVARFDGNRTQAARALGISVRTLQRKLKSWGIHSEDEEEA